MYYFVHFTVPRLSFARDTSIASETPSASHVGVATYRFLKVVVKNRGWSWSQHTKHSSNQQVIIATPGSGSSYSRGDKAPHRYNAHELDGATATIASE